MAEARHRVAAVVPVLDEAAAIGEVVAGLLAAGACCAYVVDGGSRDGTRDVARTAGAVIVDEPRRGYGRACLTGAEEAARDHPVLAFLDGDGSCDPADLPGLLAAMERADVALGRRVHSRIEAGALPWHARLGNALVAAILRWRTGRPVHDLSPFKVLRRRALAVLDLDDAGYGWTVQLVGRSLMTQSLRVAEHPIGFGARRGGTSKVSGSLRASAAAARRMLRNAVHETRPRPVVALMAKPPRLGVAKTRLAAGIGDEAALEFWRACLADLGSGVGAAARAAAVHTLAVVPSTADRESVADALGAAWEVLAQERAGLSGAITDAVVAALRRGAPMAVVISGDHPTLPWSRIDDAFAALRRAPAVLGPSPDGGYYLIGFRLAGRRSWPGDLGSVLDRVFAAATLGNGQAFQSTRRALEAEGLAPTIVGAWADVDVAGDLPALAETVRSRPPGVAPATSQWLERHGHLEGVPRSRSAIAR